MTTHLHVVPTLRISGVIPLLPLYAFVAWMGTCTVPFIALQSGDTKRYCCCWLQHEHGPYFHPVCRCPTNQTKTLALLRLSAERKDVLMALRQTGCVSGNYIIVRLFVCLLHYIFSHQLLPPVHNANSTTQCIGVVCLRTELWRAV